ncbi:MAG: hypothetical protein LC785_09785 [Acidobacteria bacterium]|nr:hypothetical protein [Acidobacteriota bacterium]
MRRLPLKEYGNPRVRRERDRASLRRQIVLLACGLLTAGGFVLAVGQRFTAVRYGYQSEQLRAERARLAAEREDDDGGRRRARRDRAATLNIFLRGGAKLSPHPAAT